MLALCADAGLAVVPQGGNIGLVGEVVLSLTRLDQLGPVDQEAAQVTAGAGGTLGRVAEADPELDLGSSSPAGTAPPSAGQRHRRRGGGDERGRGARDRGGSISAEHGIGALKARWLPLARTEAERGLFGRIRPVNSGYA